MTNEHYGINNDICDSEIPHKGARDASAMHKRMF